MNIWKEKAREMKLHTYTLYFAYRDPRVPWYAKGFVALIVVYAFSPIDLIPDFIPVLGYLDDLVIIPLGVYLALRMIPSHILDECRENAKEHLSDGKPRYKFMTIIVVCIWVLAIILVGILLAKVILRLQRS